MNLQEASLNRLNDTVRTREFVCISACRGLTARDKALDPRELELRVKRLKAENASRMQELKKRVSALCLGYVHQRGIGQETLDGVTVGVEEDSLLVVNAVRKTGETLPDFKEQMLTLARLFSQDAMLWSAGDNTALLDVKTGDVIQKFNKLRFGVSAFYSQLRRHKSKAWYVENVYRGGSFFTMWARYCEGEITNPSEYGLGSS